MQLVRSASGVLYIVGESGGIGVFNNLMFSHNVTAPDKLIREGEVLMGKRETDELVRTIFKTIEGVLADG